MRPEPSFSANSQALGIRLEPAKPALANPAWARKPQAWRRPRAHQTPDCSRRPFIKLHAPLGMKTHFSGLAQIVCIA